MVKANPSTILLKGHGHAMFEGIVSNAAIRPGSLVMMHTDGTIRVQATADRRPPALVAVEYELEGQGIDVNYAVGSRIKYVALTAGQEFYGLVPSGEAAITVGARLTAGAGGTLANSAAANDDFAIALEAVDNSGGGAAVRIKARVV